MSICASICQRPHSTEDHLLVSYVNNRIGRNSGPDDIDDDALLEFWIDQSSDEDGSDFRTYTSVFQAGVELRKAMAHALNKFRMSGARSIGTDVEAGEVDPGDIEEAVEAIESDMSPLAALAVEPLESIKFLTAAKRRQPRKSPTDPVLPSRFRSLFFEMPRSAERRAELRMPVTNV